MTVRREIHATDLAAIAGLSPYQTRHDVYLRIVEGVEVERPADMLRKMAHGKAVERPIADQWAADKGKFLADGAPKLFNDWLTATPDFFVGDARQRLPELLECKNVGLRMARDWGQPGTDEIPTVYLCQVAVYRKAFEVDAVFVAACIAGDPYEEYVYRENEDFEAMLFEAGEKFYRDNIVPRRMPEFDGGLAADQILRARKSTQPMRDATENEVALAALYAGARALRDDAETKMETLVQTLKNAIGDAGGLMLPDGGKILWKNNKDSPKTNWQAVADELGAPPELIAKHTKQIPGARPFVPKLKGVE